MQLFLVCWGVFSSAIGAFFSSFGSSGVCWLFSRSDMQSACSLWQAVVLIMRWSTFFFFSSTASSACCLCKLRYLALLFICLVFVCCSLPLVVLSVCSVTLFLLSYTWFLLFFLFVGSPGCSLYPLRIFFSSLHLLGLFWFTFFLFLSSFGCFQCVCWFCFRSDLQSVCPLSVWRLFSSCVRPLSFSLRPLVYLLVASIGCVILFLVCMVHMADILSVLWFI